MNLVETDDAYEVTLEIPGIDREDLEVAVEQGVLRVHLPKQPEAKTRKIEVDVG